MALAIRLHEAVALAGRFPLLAGASLEVAEGEVVHLRGPNGAGKTSLLKVLAGLIEVHAGEAEVLGRDLRADRRAVRREVGMLGHQSYLYEELTVEENVRFAVRATRSDPGAVAPALARLDVGGRLAATPVGKCSAGQRRRTGLAILVARETRLWLLDEPYAGLDSDGRELLDDLLEGSAAAGRTVVFASHEHDRAAALSHRTIHLAGGRVTEADGEPPSVPVPSVAAGGTGAAGPAAEQGGAPAKPDAVAEAPPEPAHVA